MGGVNRRSRATGFTRGSGHGGIDLRAGQRHQRGSAGGSAACVFRRLRFKIHLRLAATGGAAPAGFSHNLRGTKIHIRNSLGSSDLSRSNSRIRSRNAGACARGKFGHILRSRCRGDRAGLGLQRGARHGRLGPAAGDLCGGTRRKGIAGSRFLRGLGTASRTGGDQCRAISARGRAINVWRTADSRRAAGGPSQSHLRRLCCLACRVGSSHCRSGTIDTGRRRGGWRGHGCARRSATGCELRIERGDCAGLCPGCTRRGSDRGGTADGLRRQGRLGHAGGARCGGLTRYA